jgi:orotidine-5'-phosphate decarboxylase
MGWDSVAPYLKYEGKGAFLLCRTSNPGGDDLQNQRLASVDGQPLVYEHIAQLAQGPWNLNGRLACECRRLQRRDHHRQFIACGAVCIEWRRF